MNKDEIDKVKFSVTTWASKLQYDTRVFLFGSHLKGSATENSDLDIAVEILNIENAWILWFELEKPWREELTKLTGYKVDLQLYEGDESPKLKKYLEESSLLLHQSLQVLQM